MALSWVPVPAATEGALGVTWIDFNVGPLLPPPEDFVLAQPARSRAPASVNKTSSFFIRFVSIRKLFILAGECRVNGPNTRAVQLRCQISAAPSEHFLLCFLPLRGKCLPCQGANSRECANACTPPSRDTDQPVNEKSALRTMGKWLAGVEGIGRCNRREMRNQQAWYPGTSIETKSA